MKKILLVTHDFSVTGAPNSLLRQAKYLKESGYIIDVCSLKNGPLKQRYIDAEFNPVIIGENPNSILKYVKTKCLDYDLVICNTIVTYNFVHSLQIYKIPTIWFIRETKMVDEYIEKNSIFKSVFSSFYNLYTVSEYAANVIKKYNPNVAVIHNAIFDTCSNKTLEIKQNDCINFGFIGSLIDVKGIDLLVDSFLNLYKQDKNIKLYIAGKLVESDYVNKMIEKTKDNDNVTWLGEIQLAEKEKFFNNIDVLCVPSLDDPCPLTVIEGAMRSKVIIATKNTGSNFIIKENESGFIVETNSVKALQIAMKKITNVDMYKMKQISRKRYEELGTTEREKNEVLSMVKESLIKENQGTSLKYRISRRKYLWNLIIKYLSLLYPKKRMEIIQRYSKQIEVECK